MSDKKCKYCGKNEAKWGDGMCDSCHKKHFPQYHRDRSF